MFLFFFNFSPRKLIVPKALEKEPEESHIPLVSIIPLKYVQILVPNNSITLLTATGLQQISGWCFFLNPSLGQLSVFYWCFTPGVLSLLLSGRKVKVPKPFSWTSSEGFRTDYRQVKSALFQVSNVPWKSWFRQNSASQKNTKNLSSKCLVFNVIIIGELLKDVSFLAFYFVLLLIKLPKSFCWNS